MDLLRTKNKLFDKKTVNSNIFNLNSQNIVQYCNILSNIAIFVQYISFLGKQFCGDLSTTAAVCGVVLRQPAARNSDRRESGTSANIVSHPTIFNISFVDLTESEIFFFVGLDIFLVHPTIGCVEPS
jgi:hypothetical protein